MKKPTIELRSIDLHVGLSEETPAYTARLFVDGRYFADVSNPGHGGCDMVYPPREKSSWGKAALNQNDKGFHARLESLEERIKATYPPHEFDDMTLEESLEGLCHARAWESVERRNLRSQLSRKVMIVKDGGVYSIAGKKSSAQIDRVAERYPDATILNSMKFDDAFALFKEHASCST